MVDKATQALAADLDAVAAKWLQHTSSAAATVNHAARTLEALAKETERAYQALEICGIQRDRISSIPHGIQAYMISTDNAASHNREIRRNLVTCCDELTVYKQKSDALIRDMRSLLHESQVWLAFSLDSPNTEDLSDRITKVLNKELPTIVRGEK